MFNYKKIYLTIDETPTEYSKKIIDFLYSKNIPAILFCLGRSIEQKPETVIYAIKKGYIIGNHSYNHSKPFSQISLKEACWQIKKTDNIIDDIYKQANVKRPVKLFRFPWGNKGCEAKIDIDNFSNFSILHGTNSTIKINLKKIQKNLLFYYNYKKYFCSKKQKIQNFLKKTGYLQPIWDHITYPWFIKYFQKDIDVFWTLTLKEYKKNNYAKLFNEKTLIKYLNKQSNEILLMHDCEKMFNILPNITKIVTSQKIKFDLPNFINKNYG